MSLMSLMSLNRREFLTLLAAVVAAPPTPLPPVSWTCPMHPEVVDDQAGACPICRMQLTPVRLDLVWSCQLHLDVTQPKHGGTFIMAPNNWHVEATHPASSQFRLYVYDQYSRPFIPRGFASRIVIGETSIPYKPAAGGAFLEARVPQAALPATIVVKARFEDTQPEYRFDFQFYDYSKDPK